LLVVALEFEEHDAVAELRVAGDDASADVESTIVEPESDIDVGSDGHGHHQLDVATAAAKVGGLHAEGSVAAILAEFDLDLGGIARVLAAVGMGQGGSCDLVIRQGHGWALS